MFKKLVLVVAMLSAIPSYAITRVVECTQSSNSDKFLTIVLRGGMAYLFECDFAPCTGSSDPVELGMMSGSSNEENSVSYQVTQGNYPAAKTFKIRFPQEMDAPVELTLDGRSGAYNCR